MTKEALLEVVNSALREEVRKLQEELKKADKRCTTIATALRDVMKAGTYLDDCECSSCIGARLASGGTE